MPTLIIDGARMAEILRSPTGIVAQHLIARASVVQGAAKRQAPVSNKDGGTHCLQETIVKRAVEEDPVGLSIRIVSDTSPCSPTGESYSYYVHEGTEPHDIHAAEGHVLAFMWHGEQIFVRSVHHPGTQPNRFLSDNLPLAVA